MNGASLHNDQPEQPHCSRCGSDHNTSVHNWCTECGPTALCRLCEAWHRIEIVGGRSWQDNPELFVRELASEVWTPEGVDLWYDAPNPSLHNATPRQYVEAGDADKVLAMLDGLLGGAFG